MRSDAMEIFEWIRQELKPRSCNSEELIYDDMESQSCRSLPIIYQHFDTAKKAHWRDRGAAFDFLYSIMGEHKRLLDFGPGDGWPSLIVAPFATEVIGVEGSHRRVEVCTQNAERLGIENARFLYVAPGEPLPFEDSELDGVMAASSVEQTPGPEATLAELFRVLKPGGRLRINYESLNRYRDGQERALWLFGLDGGRCRLILEDRDIDGERAVRYGLTYGIGTEDLKTVALNRSDVLSFENIALDFFETTRGSIVDACACVTIHPSGPTLKRWLRDTGFSDILPTQSGIYTAGELFDNWPEATRPADMEALDRLLSPIVKTVVKLPAPIGADPMITAVK
jgi:SAM-dependent methyltransferase